MKRILVVSQRNSCRSQMAEGWLNYYGKGAIEVVSAGIDPTELDLHAANAMSEAIIEIAHQKAKGIAQVVDKEYRYVLVLASDIEHVLPAFKGEPHVYEFPFPDVAGKQMDDEEKKKAYGELRDEIENFCFDFVHQKIKPLF